MQLRPISPWQTRKTTCRSKWIRKFECLLCFWKDEVKEVFYCPFSAVYLTGCRFMLLCWFNVCKSGKYGFSSILPYYCLKSLFEGIFTHFFVLVLHLFAFAYLCKKNALTFWLKCTCVLIQTYLRFGLNALAFFKELRVLLFSAIGEVCRGICLCLFLTL